MSVRTVIEAAKNGDFQLLRDLVAEKVDVNEQDEGGWTALNWAAGRGDSEAVVFLVENGADVTLTGSDKRTALMIARAAKRDKVVEILTSVEKTLGVWKDPRATQPYCKAYHLGELRRFENWSELPVGTTGEASRRGGTAERPRPSALDDSEIVFLHQDFAVTKTMWHGEEVIFDQVTPEWKAFCHTTLEFPIPPDLA